MSDDKEKEDLKTIHKEALESFALALEKDKKQRELAIEDMLFVDSEEGQWDDTARSMRKGRPMYTIDLTSEALNQVIGDQRQSRTWIKISPDGGGADKDTAEIFSGLIRSIEKLSDADESYDNSFKESLKGGYGGWRILTKYNSDDSFEQDICIEPILSAVSSLYFDVDAVRYDKSDATEAWLITEMSVEAFKKAYPDAEATDFSNEIYYQGSCAGWFSKDTVRLAEYWRKEPCIKTIALMSNGDVIDKDEEESVLDELAAKGITVEKERKVKSYKVCMYKMNGAEVLEGPSPWAGSYIPLVPEYGKISHVNGQSFIHGMVRKAKDAARIYNYTTSAKIEAAALAPKDPIFATPAMMDGFENDYETMNTSNKPVIRYSPDPQAPGGMPQRLGAPQMQSALIEQTQQAAMDVHSTMGMHSPALGNGPQLLSEKSMLDQAEKGDRGAFEYRDNLEKSKAYTGKILVDLIPRIYDTPRIIQVLNEDGTIEERQINQQAINDFNETVIDEETGKPVIVNDLSKGKYAVTVETGPAYKSMRDKTVTQLTDLAAASPVFAELTTDIIAKNMNIAESDEITKRIRRRMIQQGAIDPTPEEIKEMGLDKPQQPDKQQQSLIDNVDMQTEDLKAGIEQKDAKTQETLVNTQLKAAETYAKLVDAMDKQVKLGVPLTQQQRMLLVTQGDIVAGAQDITQEGQPNSEQAAGIAQMIQSGQLPAQ